MTISLALGWLSPPRRASPLVALALALTACPSPEPGAEGPPGPAGVPGTVGDAGPQGDDGIASLVDSSPIGRGDAECPYGGIRYDVGLDDGSNGGVAGDGVLQQGEIDHTDRICAPAGSSSDLYDLPVPDGPVGAYLMELGGGDGGAGGHGGYGGMGGSIDASVGGTNGHILAVPNGIVDDGFGIPSSDGAYLGDDPLIVTGGTTRTVVIIATGQEATVPTGGVFTYRNDSTTDESLYFRRSGSNFQVTGIRVDVGSTLILPNDPSRSRSLAVVPYDIVNAGTITTPLGATGRTPLYLGAFHYYGETTGRIDLTGAAGTSTVAGTNGGSLLLLTARDPQNRFSNYSSGSWDAQSCELSASGVGGVYNRGTIDVSVGAWGVADSMDRHGVSVHLCAQDEVYNEGLIVARGAGPSAWGGWVGMSAFSGAFDRGAIDIRGGAVPYGSGRSGVVQVTGDRVVFSGFVDGSSASASSTANCAVTDCWTGNGGQVYLHGGGGGVVMTATLDLRAGDALGLGGVYGSGGEGGHLAATASPRYDSTQGAFGPVGAVWIGGDIDARGGAGNERGGDGGSVDASVYGGEGAEAVGQGVTFVGYPEFRADGGDGRYGGEGGQLSFYGGESAMAKASTPSVSDAPSAVVGPVAEVLTGGPTFNYVPFYGRGGAGFGIGAGGRGGSYELSARMPAPWSTAMAISRAPVDLAGGSGPDGGRGGFAFVVGAAASQMSGAVSVRGGAGNPTGANGDGYGGQGGLAAVLSQYDVGALLADVDLSGGSGYIGGYGGEFYLYGPQVDGAGNVSAPGGAGAAETGGQGGWGGEIRVWSADTFSVVTGTLAATGATGATAGEPGLIAVDGFVWQSPD